MGFLDRLVGDMLQESTGLPVKRLVRKVGGGNILLAGAGALLAGSLADKFNQGQVGPGPSSGPPAGTVPPVPGAPAAGPPPPPPPPPGAATAPPPPPPVPGAPPPLPEADDDALPQELTYAIVRTMAAAALADGDLASQERQVIQKRLGESGLSSEQIRQIDHDLVKPPTPEELATLSSDAEVYETLYRFGALIVLADQQTTDTERSWLAHLATAFELSDERRQALEEELFADNDSTD